MSSTRQRSASSNVRRWCIYVCTCVIISKYKYVYIYYKTSYMNITYMQAYCKMTIIALKKPAKMAEKWPRVGGARPSWQLAWTVNWVDRLRTSADKRMWSGRRIVVMVRWTAVYCGCSALIRRSSWTGDWSAGHKGYPPPDCSGQGERQSFLASSWASRTVAAAPLFQTCFACVQMYILYACVYICVCVNVCGHVYIYICACVYEYVYVCVYTHVYVYVYAYDVIDVY